MSHLRKGRLKIYFGYAPGVGKTYQMLADARQMEASGVDILIGFLETHGRSDILDGQGDLEVVPPVKVTHRGGVSEEVNLDAILERNPQACVVDELAHANVSNATRPKRWADVQALRQSGIDVLTTLDVQSLASLTDQIWHLTGLRVRETVPDWLFQEADDIVVVDVTPRALIHRLERGVIFPPGGRIAEMSTFYSEPTLDALRELALRQTAQALEARQSRETPAPDSRSERILVNVTAHSATAMLLRRARRVADFLHAGCVAVCVHGQRDFSSVPIVERQAIERHLRFAESLQIQTALIQGKSPARTLVDYSRKNGITQIFVQGDREEPKRFFPGWQFTDQLVQQGRGLEITVVAEPTHEGSAPFSYPEDEAGALMHSGYVRLSPDITVGAAIAEIRHQAASIEMIHYAYVLDESGHLLGVLSFRQLLSADRSRPLREVMRPASFFVSENADKQAIAELAARHRLLAVPVVDGEHRLKGIVNSVDIVAIVQQAASEDIQKMGGMEALDGAYLEVTFAQMVRKRAGWLAILFLGEMLTATAMSYYSDEISKAVVLALFLPLIISSGGNSGSQATTLVIRAMALGELRLRDWPRVIGRELMTGLALGVFLGIIGISRILLWQATRGSYGPHYGLVALTIGCSLVGVVLFGTLAGSMLPFILRRCGLDPASASAPFVATLVDVTGLIIYFTVANFILRGSML